MPSLNLFGVSVADVTTEGAIGILQEWLNDDSTRARIVYFVNTHTLNIANQDPLYRDILNQADIVFGDGSGVRLAARVLHGVRVKANVNGNDLLEPLLERTAGSGYRCYLLGATNESIEGAAEHVRRRFPGWQLVGYHHGYFDDTDTERLIAEINSAKPDLLLVGMGNPLQERWIHRHAGQLHTRICAGVGGLFDYWSGELSRAPLWLRGVGAEWLYLLLSQPKPNKFRRYVIGNPMFVIRVMSQRLAYMRSKTHHHRRGPDS